MFLTELFAGFGRVVATALEGAKNAVVANLTVLSDDDSADEQPLYGQIGFYARPKPPRDAESATPLDPEGEPEVVVLRMQDELIPTVGRDLRLNALVNPKEGSIGLVQYGGGSIDLSDNASSDGTTVTIYTPRKGADGTAEAAHVIALDTSKDASAIVIQHEKGAQISINKDGHIVLCTGDGAVFVELDVTNGQLKFSAPTIRTTSTTILGTSVDTSVDTSVQALAKKDTLEAYLVAMKSLLMKVDTQLKGVGQPGIADDVAGLPPLEYTENVVAK